MCLKGNHYIYICSEISHIASQRKDTLIDKKWQSAIVHIWLCVLISDF